MHEIEMTALKELAVADGLHTGYSAPTPQGDTFLSPAECHSGILSCWYTPKRSVFARR
jgi:hypothetical protein